MFVSSHLMSEMALTADHLIVIGRGRLIADTTTAELISSSSQGYVLVRTPDADGLAHAFCVRPARRSESTDDAVRVTGSHCAAVGDLAAEHHVVLHELSPHAASLEEAFMELTRDSVDFGADFGTAMADTAAGVGH